MAEVDLTPKDWADDFVYGGHGITSPTELVLRRLRERAPGRAVVRVVKCGQAVGKSTSLARGKTPFTCSNRSKRRMYDRISSTREDTPVDFEHFKRAFSAIAGHLKWFLDGEFFCKIRTRLDGQTCCPIQALGWSRSATQAGDRFVPSPREMLTMAGLSDRQGVILIHHADGLEASRHWQPELREWLLKTCNLRPKEASTPSA